MNNEMLEFENEFYDLLRSMDGVGAFDHIALIGSWTLFVYKDNGIKVNIMYTTSDVDFSFPIVNKIIHCSIVTALTNLDYAVEGNFMSDSEKYHRLSSENSLAVEFLCPPNKKIDTNTRTEHGKTYNLPKSGIRALALRYQDKLTGNTVKMNYRDIQVAVPSPEYWVFHKFAIAKYRKADEKRLKDLSQAGSLMESIGTEKVMGLTEKFSGKFLKDFHEGLAAYKDQG